jgi:hypothetical protein
MSLEKQISAGRIEVLENGCVQVRTCVSILEDGKLISSAFHRHVIVPGSDYSQEDARVQSICASTHTPEVIEAYKAATTAQGV